MKTLLIYEIIPEHIKFYVFDASEEQQRVLAIANGLWFNLSDMTDEQEKACTLILNAICEKSEYIHNESDPLWDQQLVKYKIPIIDLPKCGLIECVYVTGFFM